MKERPLGEQESASSSNVQVQCQLQVYVLSRLLAYFMCSRLHIINKPPGGVRHMIISWSLMGM